MSYKSIDDLECNKCDSSKNDLNLFNPLTSSIFDSVELASRSTISKNIKSIITNGYYKSGDNGGGLYIESPTEPTVQPKLYNPSIKRWFRGSESEMDIRRFGVVGSGSGLSNTISKNDIGLADSKEWLFNRNIDGVSPILLFSPGIYDYSNFPNYAKSRVSVKGKGDVKLRFHGSGTAIKLDGEAVKSGSAAGVWEMEFSGFILETPKSANGGGIILKAIHESDLGIEVRGCNPNHAGMTLQWLVSSRIRYRCAVNGFGWYDEGIPLYSLFMDDHNPDVDFDNDGIPDYTATSFCHIHADTTSSPYGLYLHKSNGSMIRGTFQSHGDVAVVMDLGCQDTILFNSDMEANRGLDAYIQGNKNSIRDSVSAGTTIIENGSFNTLSGGQYTNISVAGSGIGNRISTSFTNLADTAKQTMTHGSINRLNNTVYKRPAQTVAPLSYNGSVAHWTNNYGDPVLVRLVGGILGGMGIDSENIPESDYRNFYIIRPGSTVGFAAAPTELPEIRIWGF